MLAVNEGGKSSSIQADVVAEMRFRWKIFPPNNFAVDTFPVEVRGSSDFSCSGLTAASGNRSVVKWRKYCLVTIVLVNAKVELKMPWFSASLPIRDPFSLRLLSVKGVAES
mmetsp:Transcript_56516/g.169051  ORF Transcript_56516/g.169051 Transcript_56516/m.169051 type:complete len:111 (+) Transcript_56516:1227-1559(+)